MSILFRKVYEGFDFLGHLPPQLNITALTHTVYLFLLFPLSIQIYQHNLSNKMYPAIHIIPLQEVFTNAVYAQIDRTITSEGGEGGKGNECSINELCMSTAT